MKIETKRLIITEFDMSMAESVHINSLDVHIPQELRIRSRGTERHSASN